MATQERLMKTSEVAERFGCSERTVIRMREQKQGPTPVRIGPRLIRYRESEVERYLITGEAA